MQPILPSSRLLRLGLTALGLALCLAAASVVIHRSGPEYGVFGNLCGAAADEACYRPLLNAGWPLGYVYDRPGVAVEQRLGLEDRLSLWRFMADTAFYWGLLAIAWRFGQARRRRREPMHRRGPSSPRPD